MSAVDTQGTELEGWGMYEDLENTAQIPLIRGHGSSCNTKAWAETGYDHRLSQTSPGWAKHSRHPCSLTTRSQPRWEGSGRFKSGQQAEESGFGITWAPQRWQMQGSISCSSQPRSEEAKEQNLEVRPAQWHWQDCRMTDSALRTDFKANGAGRAARLLIPNVQAKPRSKGPLCLPLPQPLQDSPDGFQSHLGFPCGSTGKESTCNEGDLGSIPGLGRSSGEWKGHPLQYSGLENSMDCIVHGVVHGVAKSQTERLSLSLSKDKSDHIILNENLQRLSPVWRLQPPWYMWPSSSHLGQSLSVPSHPSPSILQAHSRMPYLLYKLACSLVSSDCSLLPSFNRPRESSPWNLLSPQFQRVPPTIPFTPGYFLHSSAASAMYFNQTQMYFTYLSTPMYNTSCK